MLACIQFGVAALAAVVLVFQMRSERTQRAVDAAVGASDTSIELGDAMVSVESRKEVAEGS